MSFLSSPQPGTSSEVRDLFFAPLTAVLQSGVGFRSCPSLSDPTWIYAGVERVVSSVKSGREFLQNFFPWAAEGLALSPYFKALRSARRTTKVGEVAALVRAQADQMLPNGLHEFAALKDFAVYAGDGHYLAHATHDPKTEATHWPTGFFFAMDLKTQTLRLLALADAKGRKKEHDLRALKRLEREQLRQGAPVGTKVLWVWDKAGIDLPFWKQAKQVGVYFLCLKKANQCLELAREREVDQGQPINQGVAWDRLVVDRRGITLREIGFNDPLRAQPYVYLTSEFTLEPGLLVLLYTRRWGIEKVFDETKNKFNQRKAWATSVEAKETQAHFLCLAHNLTLLFEHHLETAHQVHPEAELQRQRERQRSLEQASQSLGQVRPWLYSLARRLTQTTYKLVRWLQYHWKINTPLLTALAQLRLLYAKL